MTQLSYQPAFDAYNAAFRMLSLRQSCWSDTAVSFESLRIADFYLLFPFLLDTIKVRREHVSWKSIAKKYEYKRPYARLPDAPVIFRRMLPFQVAAFERIVDSDYALLEYWEKGNALASPKCLPSKIREKIELQNKEQADLLLLLSTMIKDYPLLGPDGLKARTQLQEHRYDAI